MDRHLMHLYEVGAASFFGGLSSPASVPRPPIRGIPRYALITISRLPLSRSHALSNTVVP